MPAVLEKEKVEQQIEVLQNNNGAANSKKYNAEYLKKLQLK